MGLSPKPNNFLNEEWDYVCVISVDGRFVEARRIWNHEYWRQTDDDNEGEDGPGIRMPDIYTFIGAQEIIEFCIPRTETVGADQLEVTFVKMKTPEDGLMPIDPSLGWDNFEGYEKVCEATVPVSWLVPSE